jgi:hypothetical protein
MRTSVGLAHYCYNSDATCCSYRFSLEEWNEFRFVVFRNGTDDLDKFRCFGHMIFLSCFGYEGRKDNFFFLLVGLNDSGDDL